MYGWLKLNPIKLIAIVALVIGISSPSFASKIIELKINGAIGPATADYIDRNINNSQDADLIIVIIDTPGGLDLATRSIVQQFLSSKVPVVVYVSPTGSRAASAGTYLIYASTLAAMAPGTQLGAASPVSLDAGVNGSNSSTQKSTMDKKIFNDAVATIRSLAQLRGRNQEFAQNAVVDAATMTDTEALKSGVINFIAKDEQDLLVQLNGLVVTQNNKQIKIDTTNPRIEVITPGWRTDFLAAITNPNVAYFLILLGLYGIFFELLNPGFVLPGVIGGVSMLTALYALQLLPVNYTGLGLMILGVIFIIGEGHTHTFGVLSVGGTVSFVLGSIMLINTTDVAYQIAWSVIWAMTVINIAILLLLFSMVFRAQRRRTVIGLSTLIGSTGRALGEINLEGLAVIRGEIWSVHAKTPISINKKIKVINVDGLYLEVKEVS